MTNNVVSTKVVAMEDFSFDAMKAASDGISRLIFDGSEHARFEIGPGYGHILGDIKSGQFFPVEIDIMDVGSRETWERFTREILPISKGYILISALFESHDVCEVESFDGDVEEEWREW